MRQTSIAQLFEFGHEKLKLTWVDGNEGAVVKVTREDVSPADLVGHLNMIHPDRIQVLGSAEVAWLGRQPDEKQKHIFCYVLGPRPPAVIVADGFPVPAILLNECKHSGVPIMTTPMPSANVIDQLRNYLARKLAERTSLHGVLMDVLGMGVLVTGESGVGKSELALELISRGHGLVADDIVEFYRIAPNALEGHCPEMLRDFLEVRGLGVLNIRTVFGETACRRKMKLKLVVHLQRPGRGNPEAMRLPLDAETQDILGVRVRRVTIPVAAGRNLAVLLEAAVRSSILLLRGIDTTLEFVDRQRLLISDGEP
jgi:HPr kinase/phosphorylase